MGIIQYPYLRIVFHVLVFNDGVNCTRSDSEMIRPLRLPRLRPCSGRRSGHSSGRCSGRAEFKGFRSGRNQTPTHKQALPGYRLTYLLLHSCRWLFHSFLLSPIAPQAERCLTFVSPSASPSRFAPSPRRQLPLGAQPEARRRL
jgi:hypothetical protein